MSQDGKSRVDLAHEAAAVRAKSRDDLARETPANRGQPRDDVARKQEAPANRGKTRDDLEHEADAVRARLMLTVQRLERRRHQVLDVRYQLRRHVQTVVVLGAVAVVATAAAVALATHRVATAAARRRRNRWRLAKNVWRRPDRALRAARGPFFQEALRGVGLSLVSMALTTPARSLLKEIFSAAASVRRGSSRASADGESRARRQLGPAPM